MGLGSTQGERKWLLFGNRSSWKRRPLLCHPDRSASEVEGPAVQPTFTGNVFRHSVAEWICGFLRFKQKVIKYVHELTAIPGAPNPKHVPDFSERQKGTSVCLPSPVVGCFKAQLQVRR
jgi:hypothetical protein